ncbi:hypothetical protein OFM39_34145, partial [Escherichia coli]|nr:hypothetical protein [Escherichia coli]
MICFYFPGGLREILFRAYRALVMMVRFSSVFLNRRFDMYCVGFEIAAFLFAVSAVGIFFCCLVDYTANEE